MAFVKIDAWDLYWPLLWADDPNRKPPATLDELIAALEADVESLKVMRVGGVRVEQYRDTPRDQLRLMTKERALAERFGFGQMENWQDETEGGGEESEG
jgi:hypothetical protein